MEQLVKVQSTSVDYNNTPVLEQQGYEGESVQEFIEHNSEYNSRTPSRDGGDYFVGAFFNNNTPDRKITLFKSYNNTWFEAINTTLMMTDQAYFLSGSSTALSNTTAVRGDPDITYFNGKWHMAVTGGHPNPPIGSPRDAIVHTSDDMITWTPREIKMGPTLLYGQSAVQFGGTTTSINQIWAPALHVTPEGDVWIVATVGINPNAPDIYGQSVTWAAAVGCKCNDLDALTFDPPQLLLQDISVQRLDPQLHQDLQGRYVIAIKNEYNKHIELWRSSTVVGGYTRIADLDYGGINVEGPCLTYSKRNQLWYCYADAYDTLGDYYAVTSPDMITWSAATPLRTTEILRHGTVQNLSMLPEGQQAMASFTRASTILGQMSPQKPLFGPRGQFATSGSTNLIPENGMVYRVLNNASRRLFIDDIGTTQHFYLACTSDDPKAGIVVSGSKLHGGLHYIGFGRNSRKIVKVHYDERFREYYIEGDGERLLSTSLVSFSTVGNGWPTVGAGWAPQHGMTYSIADASQNTTIQGIYPDQPDGTYFHVLINNDTVGTFTVNSSAAGVSIGGTAAVFTGASHGNRLITMKKVGGAWRLMLS